MHGKSHKFYFSAILLQVIIGLSDAKDVRGTFKANEADSEEHNTRTERRIEIIPTENIVQKSVGDALQLTCIGIDASWISNSGAPVESTNKEDRIFVEDSSTPETNAPELKLFFDKIDISDEGTWTCKDQFEAKAFTLLVYVPTELSSTNQHVKVKEYENANLNCKAIGQPKPTIRWRFNGVVIVDNLNNVDSDKYLKWEDSLIIKQVTREDAGSYTCEGFQPSNPSDVKQLPIQLDVNFKPEILYTERTHLNGKLNTTTGIIITYSHLKAKINLTCEAIGNPAPSLKWYHHGKRVDHTISEINGISILTIHFHTNRSFGDYKCIAKNNVGQDNLKIQVREANKPPTPTEVKLMGSTFDALDIYIGPEPNISSIYDLPVTHFRIEMISKDNYTKNGNNWKDHQVKDVEANFTVSYLISNLIQKTTYMVRVASLNAGGMSEWTETKEFTTLGADPSGSDSLHILRYDIVMIAIIINLLTVMY